MPKITYNGIDFDSEEERLVYLYLEELKVNGFVKDYSYHVQSFTLSKPAKYTWTQKVKNKEQKMESTLLQGHIYTPDFWIEWNEKAQGIFYQNAFDEFKLKDIPFINNGEEGYGEEKSGTYVEVKPAFDMNNMQRLFAINQKWIFEKSDIYVQKIIPVGKKNCLFAKTFVPQEAMFTAKQHKLKKYKFEIKSLKDFLGGFNE